MEFNLIALQDAVIMFESNKPLLFYTGLIILAFWDALIVLGIFLPGTFTVVFFGYIAAGGDLSFAKIFIAVSIGAVLGDLVNFYIGKRFGKKLLVKLPFVKERQVNASADFFNTYGSPSVLFVRFITFLKDIVPTFAGSVGMNTRTFIVWNSIGVICWAFAYLAIGYGISNITDEMADVRTRALTLMFVVIAVGTLTIGVNKLLMGKVSSNHSRR